MSSPPSILNLKKKKNCKHSGLFWAVVPEMTIIIIIIT